MRTRCPACKTIVNVPHYVSDYIHDCVNNANITVMQQEDVPQLGPWSDADGLASPAAPGLSAMPRIEGQVDKLQGTTADFGPHDRVPDFTSRGAPMDTTRQKNRYTYFTTKEGQVSTSSRPVNNYDYSQVYTISLTVI